MPVPRSAFGKNDSGVAWQDEPCSCGHPAARHVAPLAVPIYTGCSQCECKSFDPNPTRSHGTDG